MAEEERQWHKVKVIKHGGGGGAIYGIGVIGALIYFLQHATTFTDGILGIIKAIAWPALMVYKALEQLKF